MKYHQYLRRFRTIAIGICLFLTAFLSGSYGQGWVKTYESVPELKNAMFYDIFSFQSFENEEFAFYTSDQNVPGATSKVAYMDKNGNLKKKIIFPSLAKNNKLYDVFISKDTIGILYNDTINKKVYLDYYAEDNILSKRKLILEKNIDKYQTNSKIITTYSNDTTTLHKIGENGNISNTLIVLDTILWGYKRKVVQPVADKEGFIYLNETKNGDIYVEKKGFDGNIKWYSYLFSQYIEISSVSKMPLFIDKFRNVYCLADTVKSPHTQRSYTVFIIDSVGSVKKINNFITYPPLDAYSHIALPFVTNTSFFGGKGLSLPDNKNYIDLRKYNLYDTIGSKNFKIEKPLFWNIHGVIENSNGSIYIFGHDLSPNSGQIYNIKIAKLTPFGSVNTTQLQIRYYKDDNGDCVWSPGELLLKDKRIKVEDKSGEFTYFSSQGDTILASLDTGKYDITPQMTTYYRPCKEKETFAFNTYYDTVRVDIGLQPEVTCPYLNVEITTPMLRRCFNNTYSVHYCNTGSSEAKNAYIEVHLDKYMNYTSSTIPYSSKQGNLLRFEVGNLAINDCGDFQLSAFLNCDSTVLGQTHCTEAHIYPDSLCTATTGWDGSRIKVYGECSGDSVRFEIRNASASPMTQKSEYIVVEDDIIMSRKPFQLDANQSVNFSIPAAGRTYRLEAKQAQGHPGNSKPSVTLENCGNSNLSLGFVNQFPQDEADPFVDIDCQQNRGSFDPNDKQGFPNGYGNNKFIDINQDLEYLIRFQNTGTDTAFTVRLIDTISPYLEPECIVMGPSSHPYSYRIYDKGILEVLFDTIALPDSATNFEKSMGFVKFRISQKIALAVGTPIKNTASIYFDSNSPIETNTTLHTVGENFVIITQIPELQAPVMNIYPNPFSDETIIELDDNSSDLKTLEVFDLHGRKLKQLSFIDNRLVFKRETLTQGIYFFQISTPRKTLTQGKMVIR